ncbi:MAG TPA: hypothetical protein VKR52_01420 [Terracidiphilus sp.]|nr:hypothetical protein [Terracidiphilus sp.]
MGRKEALFILALLLCAGSLFPIPYLASPEWVVTVVDESGKPLRGMLVRLDYENYSVEDTSHEQDLTTDAAGKVTFPPHRLAATTLARFYYTARDLTALAHASFGPNAYVNAFGRGLQGEAESAGVTTFWTGHPDRMESTITAKRQKN